MAKTGLKGGGNPQSHILRPFRHGPEFGFSDPKQDRWPSKKRTFTPIRWTFERAGAEFGLNPRTVSKRAHGAGIIPGDDGKFSTRDIAKALFDAGNRALVAERTKALKLSNKKAEWDLREREETWVSVDEMIKRLTPMTVAMRTVILSSGLSPDEQDNMFDALRKLVDDAMSKEPYQNSELTEPSK